MNAKELINLITEAGGVTTRTKKSEEIPKKAKKKFSITIAGGKSDIPAASYAEVLKAIKGVPDKKKVEVFRTSDGKKVAYGPAKMTTAIVMALKTKSESAKKSK